MYKSKPDISHLRVLGCAAYVYLPEDKRPNKLAPHAELMTYLDIPEGVKEYLFMHSTNVLFNGGTAQFMEDTFPRCPKPNDHTPIPTVPDHISESGNDFNDEDIDFLPDVP